MITALKHLALAVVVSAVTALAPTSALANGGANIASAPAMPIGTPVSGGAATVDNYTTCCKFWAHPDTGGVEYWRINTLAGDQLTIDWTDVAGTYVSVCLMTPDITDFTVGDVQDCAAYLQNNAKRELRFTVPTPGAWILAVGDDWCCNHEGWAYDLITYVKHKTSTMLTANSPVRAHRQATLHGAVSGVAAGKVVIQRRGKTGGWTTVGLKAVRSNGSFVFKTRVGAARTYRYRAQFLGDDSHLPSSATCAVKVV
jgi:hypothetical protein